MREVKTFINTHEYYLHFTEKYVFASEKESDKLQKDFDPERKTQQRRIEICYSLQVKTIFSFFSETFSPSSQGSKSIDEQTFTNFQTSATPRKRDFVIALKGRHSGTCKNNRDLFSRIPITKTFEQSKKGEKFSCKCDQRFYFRYLLRLRMAILLFRILRKQLLLRNENL